MFAMFTIIAHALLISLKKHNVTYIHIDIYMGFTCNPIHLPFKASLQSVFLKKLNFTVFHNITKHFQSLKHGTGNICGLNFELVYLCQPAELFISVGLPSPPETFI